MKILYIENFHPLGLLQDKHSKELNFSTLFYSQPQQFFEQIYQQIIQWELFHNFRISNLSFKSLHSNS
jgi:hypothetical protein